MEGFAGWGQGREKKGGIEEKQREGTGSLDSWFLRGLSLSRERKLREAGKICGWWGDTFLSRPETPPPPPIIPPQASPSL